MTAADLLVIVPTRSRPEAVPRVVEAWENTGAFLDGAELLFVVDADDPAISDYVNQINFAGASRRVMATWQPLVPKLNAAAATAVRDADPPFAIGFAGDDHLPRTPGWVRRYVDTLRAAGTGIVYGDDGYQHEKLPTQWAMTSDIVRALGGMIPAPVEHLYCDNAVHDLGQLLGRLYYLGDVLIEHMHPVAGKAETDEQYERVNSRQQYRGDRPAYRRWLTEGGLDQAARRVIEQTQRGRTP